MKNDSNKVFILVLVVALGIFVGYTLASKQSGSPVMKEMMDQQSETLRAIKSLKSDGGADGSVLSALLSAQADLQKRVAAIEAKLQGLNVDRVGRGQKGSPRAQPPSEDYDKKYDLALEHSYVRGAKDAKVTITEFVDFQCPFCARFHPAINQVLEAYPKDVNYVLKNFPLSFHPQGKPAAKAAYAAGEQGKYWEMVDLILEDNSGLSLGKYREHAKTIGLNMDKFEADLKKNDKKWDDWIVKDMELGAKSDVRGTPTFYLNGKKTPAREFSQYKTVIDQILGAK